MAVGVSDFITPSRILNDMRRGGVSIGDLIRISTHVRHGTRRTIFLGTDKHAAELSALLADALVSDTRLLMRITTFKLLGYSMTYNQEKKRFIFELSVERVANDGNRPLIDLYEHAEQNEWREVYGLGHYG